MVATTNPHASLICYLIVSFSGFPDSKILFRVPEFRMISVAGNVWGDGLRSMYGPYTSCGQRILRAVVWRARSILGISYQGPTMPVVQTKRNEITQNEKWELRMTQGLSRVGWTSASDFNTFQGLDLIYLDAQIASSGALSTKAECHKVSETHRHSSRSRNMFQLISSNKSTFFNALSLLFSLFLRTTDHFANTNWSSSTVTQVVLPLAWKRLAIWWMVEL